MSINNSRTWWESYREAVSITNHHNQLVDLLNGRNDLAQKLLFMKKNKYPGHEENWYLTRLIDELQHSNLIDQVS